MAVNINQVRTKYASNRNEILNRIAETYEIDLSEWTFTEISAEEKKGQGNDILVIFRSTLSKEGLIDIILTEIIDYHRLAYSYSFNLDIEEPEEPEEET